MFSAVGAHVTRIVSRPDETNFSDCLALEGKKILEKGLQEFRERKMPFTLSLFAARQCARKQRISFDPKHLARIIKKESDAFCTGLS